MRKLGETGGVVALRPVDGGQMVASTGVCVGRRSG
jgi:hypothetical protein